MNFWINLQPMNEVSTVSLDFAEEDPSWEFVMIQTKKKSGTNLDGEDESDHDEENDDEVQDEVLDMPPPWSPKLFVDKGKFNERCPNGEKTVFYEKTKVDFYSECKQVDGLVKRTTLYKDYNRIIVDEVRSEYACRIDKLKMRRRFPYQFKLVEHYDSLEDTHWKKLIQVDGHDRKLWFYHHRNKDGLIYRHEQIGYKDPSREWQKEKNKIIEKFKNRPDKLVYHSVVFENKDPDTQSLRLPERNYGKDCKISKMTQKFELDEESSKPPSQQIRKTEFNLIKGENRGENKNEKKGEILIFYHYQKGKITADSNSYVRSDIIGNANAKMDSVGEKEDQETKEQQTNKMIVEMETACHANIKLAEERASEEVKQKE
jgi:hypothetical protein